MAFLATRSLNEQTSVLAQYLREDPLHTQKNSEGSSLRKLLTGLAYEFLRERDLVNLVYDEYDPNTTTQFIEEWEKWVRIPDGCLSNTGTLDQRRKNILLKLTGINATTKQQFEAIALILGFTIIVSSGADAGNVLPLQLPFILLGQTEAPFTIIVTLAASLNVATLPLTLPFVLGNDQTEVLKCFLENLKPANTVILYRYV